MQQFMYEHLVDGTICVNGYMGDEEDVVIPPLYGDKPVTVLFDDLFKGHAEIKSVKIPDTVTNIGANVFDGCTGLKHVDLPEGLTDLWQYAFCNSSIEEITIPDKVKSIASFTFKDCKKLRRVRCGKGLENIRAWAFEGCLMLAGIDHIPGVKISRQAFESRPEKEPETSGDTKPETEN